MVMNIINRHIDHLVYCVHNMEEAINHFTKNYGITPTIGGKHIHKGTRNAIINLGHESYLEILTTDPENKTITKNRWMGIDHLTEPKITRWVLKSQNLEDDILAIKKVKPDLGTLDFGHRVTPAGKTLKWSMSIPLSSPEVELIPFLIDWSESDQHPTLGMEQSCELVKIELGHPRPEELKSCFQELGIGQQIEKSESVRFKATFKGPNGEFSL